MKKIILFALALLFISPLFAQQSGTNKDIINAVFGSDNDIYFRFTAENKAQINALSRIIAINNVKGHQVYAYADKAEFEKFLEQGITYELLPYPRPVNPKMLNSIDAKETLLWDAYPSYSAYETMMAQFASTYPALCDIDTILATTPNGHRILVAHISSNVNTAANKPQFLYASSMHGNELTGYVLMLRLIDYLLSNYGSVARATNILNNVDLWICPLSNPDGTFPFSDNSVNNAVRENSNYVDLNRNYPNPVWMTTPNSDPVQPETQAFMDFAAMHHFNMSANFHDGAELLNYPYDSKATLAPDDSWWVRVCTQWADSVHLNAGTLGSGYFTDQSNGITNGSAWYEINGGRQDYMNVFEHCREVTVELAGGWPPPPAGSDLPKYWNAQHRSLLKYIEESENGIRGIITDSCTGQPIRAKVFVNGHDVSSDSSFVYSAAAVGNYHRYLINGTYSLTYAAPGYQSKTVTGIAVSNGTPTVRNVALRSTVSPSAGFSSSVNNAVVAFTNTSSGATSWLWDFGDGNTSSLQNPSHTYLSTGTFNVKLIAYGCGADSVTLPVTITVIGMVANEAFGELLLFPNPATDILYIKNEGMNEVLSLELFTVTGIRVYTSESGNNTTDLSIDLSGMEKGIYLLKISNSKGSAVRRVVKI